MPNESPVIMYHPDLPGVTFKVYPAAVDDWAANGWLNADPPADFQDHAIVTAREETPGVYSLHATIGGNGKELAVFRGLKPDGSLPDDTRAMLNETFAEKGLIGSYVARALAEDDAPAAAAAAAVDSAMNSALPANLAAAKAYTDEELAERFGNILEPGIAFAVVDEDGRRTWIEAGPDGKPTPYAAVAITAAVGPAIESAIETSIADIGFAELDTAVTDMTFAVVDEDGRRTWIEAGRDGKPTPRTLDTLRASLALSAAPSGAVVCSGDSMTGGAFGTNYPTHLANLTGWTVINDGVGGENTTTIAGRMGGRPMLVDPVTIPASGGVTVALKSDDGIDPRGVTPLLQQDGGTNPVRIAGIEGTLTVNKTVSPPVYTFTRSAAGSAVTVNYPAPLITRAMREHHTGIHVMWWATNDTSATNNDAQYIIDRERALIEHLTEADPRYLVIGFTTGTASWRAPADVQFLRAFGRRYINLGAYLSSPAAMQDAGLTPTAEDTTAQASGTVPPSLRGDNTHLNNAGNLLAARQVAARITEMGWK